MRLSFSKDTLRSNVIAANDASAFVTSGLRLPRMAIAPTERLPIRNTRVDVWVAKSSLSSFCTKHSLARSFSLSVQFPAEWVVLELASKIAIRSEERRVGRERREQW